MLYRSILICAFFLSLFAGCTTGVRELDFVSKQFSVTYNVDSTRGIDSTEIGRLMESKAIYSFSDDGKGMNHVQMGMLSKDTPFSWKVEKDSLYIDDKAYAVRKQDKGFTLKSDSAKIILSKQP